MKTKKNLKFTIRNITFQTNKINIDFIPTQSFRNRYFYGKL